MLHLKQQHIEFYFPEYDTPNVFTVTTEDYRKKVIIYKDMILIALNTYLGADHKYNLKFNLDRIVYVHH